MAALKITGQQQQIIEFLKVKPLIDVAMEAKRRIAFLADIMLSAASKALILGISGGIDSTVAGCLCQHAVEQLRQQGHQAQFIAVRLPYGQQADERDAQLALAAIKPDETLTINIASICDQTLTALTQAQLDFSQHQLRDFILGNIKARQRMICQYAIANRTNGLVVGTDHAAEALMGFYTKFGDGGCDLAPLYGLNKRQIRALGQFFTIPATLINKTPTADLENLAPLKPDEQALGVSYNDIDDFLEGKGVAAAAAQIIFTTFERTKHKRALPITPS